MSPLPALIHDGALGLAVSGLLYAGSTMTAALVALLAPSPTRRRDARRVLALLLRRGTAEENSVPPASRQRKGVRTRCPSRAA